MKMHISCLERGKNMQLSPKKSFMKRTTAIVLAAVTVFSTSAAILTNILSRKLSDTVDVDGIKNSAAAVDVGNDTYSLDPSGNLLLKRWEDDYPTTVADISASRFAVIGDSLICTGRDGSVFTLKTDGSDKKLLFASAQADGPFAVNGSDIWYKSGDRLMHIQNGDYPQYATSVDNLADIRMISDDCIMLYADNPDYIVETNGEEFDYEEENDQYITYLYSPKSGLLIEYEENLEDDPEAISEVTQLTSGAGTVINGVSFPFADYPVGSFFTKNGGSCVCHNQGICVASPSNCNCMRYYPTGVKATCTVDLYSSQCYGFARFCQWRAYGYFDVESRRFYNAFGSKLSAGSWTANTIRDIFTSVGPGGHLRTGSGHSLFVMQVSSTGFITYECNMSRVGKNCIIYTRTWTWDSFFSTYGSRDMLWYNMPKDLDNSGEVIGGEDMKPGTYQILADLLNMREQPTTSSAIVGQIPYQSVVTITEVRKVGSYFWGHTTYDGKTGWVRLDYAVPISGNVKSIKITALPSKTTYFVGDKFDPSGLEVTAYFSDGTSVVIEGYTCTGYNMSVAGTYTVRVTASGFSDTFTIKVNLKMVYPTSVALSTGDVVSIIGDNYSLGVTLLPADTTQRTIVWTSSDEKVATVSQSGAVVVHSAGEAVITVKTENNLTAQMKVTAISMPTGTEWSVDANGNPLSALPEGIDPQDYSIRYRTKKSDGKWSDWVYSDIPKNISAEVQCQFRSFTMTFISDGKDIYEPRPVDVNTYIDISKYSMEKEGYLFAGWFTSNRAALSLDRKSAVGKEVKITGDLTLYAGWIEIGSIVPDASDPFADLGTGDGFAVVGRSVRADESSAGIRFFTRIRKSLLNDLQKLHSDNSLRDGYSCGSKGIGYGTVIIAASYLSGNLVKGSASTSYLSSKKALTVPATNIYAEYSDYLIFTALVNGYDKSYYKTDFVARPYITYRDANGFEHTYYFSYTGEGAAGGGISANLSEVADEAYENGDSLTKRMIEDYIYSKYRD